MSIIDVNKQNFKKEVLESDKPVLVDFWGKGCGPCDRLDPILKDAAEDRPNVKFVKINVQENPELAAEYHVRGVPNLLFFKEGEIVGSTSGFKTEVQLNQFIFKSLSSDEKIDLKEKAKLDQEKTKEASAFIAKLTMNVASGIAYTGKAVSLIGGAALALTATATAPVVIGGLVATSAIYGSVKLVMDRKKNTKKLTEAFNAAMETVSDADAKDNPAFSKLMEMKLNIHPKNQKERILNTAKSVIGLAQAAVTATAGVMLLASTGSFLLGTCAVLMAGFGGIATISRAIGTVKTYKLPLRDEAEKEIKVVIEKSIDAKANDNKPSPKLTNSKPIGTEFNSGNQSKKAVEAQEKLDADTKKPIGTEFHSGDQSKDAVEKQEAEDQAKAKTPAPVKKKDNQNKM